MTVAAHLAELSAKHRTLDEKIRDELARPAADEVRVAQWKREKLKLKDEIAKLARQTRH